MAEPPSGGLLHLIYQMDGTRQIAHCSGDFAFKVEAVNLASHEVTPVPSVPTVRPGTCSSSSHSGFRGVLLGPPSLQSPSSELRYLFCPDLARLVSQHL